MSRTVRKTKRGKITRDGRGYSCKCDYCAGIEKKRLEAEFAKEKIEQGIYEYENSTYEHLNDYNWH